MSLENRKRQYAMFMERGETELAEQQIKGHPELIEEIKEEQEKLEKECEVIEEKKEALETEMAKTRGRPKKEK